MTRYAVCRNRPSLYLRWTSDGLSLAEHLRLRHLDTLKFELYTLPIDVCLQISSKKQKGSFFLCRALHPSRSQTHNASKVECYFFLYPSFRHQSVISYHACLAALWNWEFSASVLSQVRPSASYHMMIRHDHNHVSVRFSVYSNLKPSILRTMRQAYIWLNDVFLAAWLWHRGGRYRDWTSSSGSRCVMAPQSDVCNCRSISARLILPVHPTRHCSRHRSTSPTRLNRPFSIIQYLIKNMWYVSLICGLDWSELYRKKKHWCRWTDGRYSKFITSAEQGCKDMQSNHPAHYQPSSPISYSYVSAELSHCSTSFQYSQTDVIAYADGWVTTNNNCHGPAGLVGCVDR